MGLGQAITTIFEDRLWINKLLIVLIMGLASLIPVVGLIALAALLGYLVEIAANVKRKVPGGLPIWSNFEKKIGDGAAVLAAVFVYNIPNFLLSGCVLTSPGFFGNDLIAVGSTRIVTLCCLSPILLIYSLLSWSMLAAGVVRFAETGKPVEFYRFNVLLEAIQRNSGATLQWVALATFLNVLFALLAATVCGIVAVLALAIPLHGHLLGQYGQRVDFAPHIAAPAKRTR
jgi:predicted PurR-regulated permease PerM